MRNNVGNTWVDIKVDLLSVRPEDLLSQFNVKMFANLIGLLCHCCFTLCDTTLLYYRISPKEGRKRPISYLLLS